MKRILFSITVLLVVFSFNISYSQNLDVDAAIKGLQSKLWIYVHELNDIQNDLMLIINATNNQTQKDAMFKVVEYVSVVSDFHLWQYLLLYTKEFVDKNKMKPYWEHILTSLRLSYGVLEAKQEEIQNQYPYLGNKSALHSTDKVRKILKDSLSEIKTTMPTLDNAIKSMP